MTWTNIITGQTGEGGPAVDYTLGVTLNQWGLVQAFQLVSATRDSNGAIVSASIVWPDGSTGTFTTDVASVNFPGAVDAWHATYVYAAGMLTIRQPAITRDTKGAVTIQPALTIE